jgi:2-amino-4-hydroxy-6-hydroxymethyldihydropteridine diphosphokinase
MPKVDVYFSLGSNIGARKRNLEVAMSMMDLIFDPRAAQSDIIETAPWGFDSENPFLNCVAKYCIQTEGWWKGPVPEKAESEAHGLWILDQCKNVETMMGRKEEVEYDVFGQRVYHDRLIDIDILLYGTERIDCQRLTVPHKLMASRDFVMFPLRQIAGDDVKSAFPEIFQGK